VIELAATNTVAIFSTLGAVNIVVPGTDDDVVTLLGLQTNNSSGGASVRYADTSSTDPYAYVQLIPIGNNVRIPAEIRTGVRELTVDINTVSQSVVVFFNVTPRSQLSPV
jgi:hypothetical protein